MTAATMTRSKAKSRTTSDKSTAGRSVEATSMRQVRLTLEVGQA